MRLRSRGFSAVHECVLLRAFSSTRVTLGQARVVVDSERGVRRRRFRRLLVALHVVGAERRGEFLAGLGERRACERVVRLVR